MSVAEDQRIEAIHASGFQACIVVSGGGIGAVHALLSRPGASQFVLDVRIPYSREAMTAYLGQAPATYCSEDTAKKMVHTACAHASRYTPHALGIACTAALQTLQERADPDRAHLCVCSAERILCETVELEPADRAVQDAIVSDALLSLIARFVAE